MPHHTTRVPLATVAGVGLTCKACGFTAEFPADKLATVDWEQCPGCSADWRLPPGVMKSLAAAFKDAVAGNLIVSFVLPAKD